MKRYNLDYLEQLESESIHILREVFASFKNPVLLYSIGKDSSVLLRLAQKAFYPGKVPFQLLHIDTGFKFKEMIDFRDYYTQKIGVDLIVHKNTEEEAVKLKPSEAHTEKYIYLKKTRPLLEAIQSYQFDAAIGGARRDEEKSRAKERVFSVRNEFGVWDPKNQRPELWSLYNSHLNDGDTMRIFPLSNWTEEDIWRYIKKENIEIVPLYFAREREVVNRNGINVCVDELTQPIDDEKVTKMMCRYRTLGCSPSTGVVPSNATTLDEIIEEVSSAAYSERETRAIDQESDSSMEQKKKEGYF